MKLSANLFLVITAVATCTIPTATATTTSSSSIRSNNNQRRHLELNCTDVDNLLVEASICGTDGKTYKNECVKPADVDIACDTSCAQCVTTTTTSTMSSTVMSGATSTTTAAAATTSSSTTFEPLSPPELNPCNNAIFDITKEDILQLFFPEDPTTTTTTTTTTISTNPIIMERLPELVNWNVRVHKICTTCEEMNTLWETQHACEPGTTTSCTTSSVVMPYCDIGTFAYGRTMSGLMLEPIDPYNNKPVVGEVGTTLFPMDVSTNPFEAFSEIKDLPAGLDRNILFPILTASSGTYTIVPDVLGNGEDWNNTRSYRVKDVYQASTIPLLLKLQDDIGTKYNCTVLDKRVAIAGYGGEGGYSAAAIAEAIDMLDDGYVHTFTAVGGAPVSTAKEQLKEIVAFFNGTYPFPALITRFVNAYSSTNQDLENTNLTNVASNDYLNATDEFKDVRSWIKYGLSDEMILSLLPSPNASDIINPEILSQLLESYSVCIDEPSKTDATANFCAAVIQNDLSGFLNDVEYPVVLCHSPNDEVSYYANVEAIPQVNEYTMMIENMPSFVGQVINPNGTHEEARQQCLLGYALQYTEPGDIRTINPPEDEACVITYTESPTSSQIPTSSPIAASPTTATEQGGGASNSKDSDVPTSAATINGISALVMLSSFFVFVAVKSVD